MSNFKVLPIAADIARMIREKMIDGAGHRLSISVANENAYGPCRSCLKQFVAGERRIIFSYSPNPVDHPFNETGPVYIHAGACVPYDGMSVFPPEIEHGRIKFPLAFRAYDCNGVMIAAVLPDGASASETIALLFENETIAFAHLRNRQFGCFIAHVRRAGE